MSDQQHGRSLVLDDLVVRAFPVRKDTELPRGLEPEPDRRIVERALAERLSVSFARSVTLTMLTKSFLVSYSRGDALGGSATDRGTETMSPTLIVSNA